MGLLDDAKTVAEDPGPWSMVIYGDSGAGKTVLACGAEKPLLVDVDQSRRSLLNHDELLTVPIIPAYDLAACNRFKNQVARDTGDWKTAIIDTVTTLQFRTEQKVMKELLAKKPDRDPDLPSQAEFNIVNRRVIKFCDELIKACKDSDRNVIFLSHIREEKDDGGAITLIRPGTTEALTQKLVPLVDAVFYYEHKAKSDGSVERKLRTVATSKVKGKNRFGSLPNVMMDPKFSEIERIAEEQRQKALALQTQTTN